jgi:hypothetical protein
MPSIWPLAIIYFTSNLFPLDNIVDCGLYDGFRKTEWAQGDSHVALDNLQPDIHSEPQAFGLYEDSAGLPSYAHLQNSKRMATTALHASRNNHLPAMCFTRCLLRIVKRFIRLVHADSTKPLCVCQDVLGKLRYITSNDINYVVRRAAAAVYKLDPVADAKSHPIPCVSAHV